MEIVLAIALSASIARTLAYKTSLRAMGIYFQKKGYTQPTDSELEECSLIAIRQMFRVKAK